jgi:hypothetical protein
MPQQQISAEQIADGTVVASDIADGTITATKLASGVANTNIGYTAANKAGESFTGTVSFGHPATFSNTTTIQQTLETTTINISAAGGTTNFDVLTSPVIYYTANCASNVTLNFRGSLARTLDSVMSTGQALSVAFVNTQLSANTFLTAAHQIDGFERSVYWQGGSTPTGGNAASLDVYGYTIIKTASNTFTILASQTQYK